MGSKIQIKSGYGYEQGLAQPRSEFAISGVTVPSSGSISFNHPSWDPQNNTDNSNTIAKVTKSQVDQSYILQVYSYFSQNKTPYSDYRVFWNTFERDWNRSLKLLGSGTTFGKYWSLQGNARYSGDWYQWVPSTTSSHHVHFNWFGWESEVKYENWKTSYTLIPEY